MLSSSKIQSSIHKSANYIFEDRILFWCFCTGLICIVLSLLLLLLFINHLPDVVPLYNQLPWGDDRLGGKTELFLPFGLSALILIVNVFLSQRFYIKIPLVSRVLAVATIITSFLILAFLARTIQLVI